MVAAVLATASLPSFSAESDAKEVFSAAAAGGMTFTANRVVEDVSLVFLHFTTQGRAALISELERTGVVAEVVGKGAALRGDLPPSAIQVKRRVGADGLDEYEVTGEMKLQWSRCAASGGSCTSAGPAKSVKVSGTVLQAVMNGRPAYRINTIRFDGGR